MGRLFEERLKMFNGKALFFWSDEHKPQDFVVPSISAISRLALAGVLVNGDMVASYRGLAMCRFKGCKDAVGSQDWEAYGYTYPNGCEHYVLEHGVWVPGCDELLEIAIKDVSQRHVK